MRMEMNDHPKEDKTPSETRVSMEVMPWRKFVHVALWNGHADQKTTGRERETSSQSHVGKRNCGSKAKTRPMSMRGKVRSTATMRRRLNMVMRRSASAARSMSESRAAV